MSEEYAQKPVVVTVHPAHSAEDSKTFLEQLTLAPGGCRGHIPGNFLLPGRCDLPHFTTQIATSLEASDCPLDVSVQTREELQEGNQRSGQRRVLTYRRWCITENSIQLEGNYKVVSLPVPELRSMDHQSNYVP